MDKEILKVLAKFDIPEQFGNGEEYEYEVGDLCDFISKELNLKEGEDFSVKLGASKIAIIFENKDTVIKIPFNGSWYDDWDEDLGWVGETFTYFGGAEAKDSTDYCAAEANLYKKIKVAGIEKLFAKTERVYELCNGFYAYEQEKAETTFCDFTCKPSANSLSIAKSLPKLIASEEFTAYCIDFYGKSFINKVFDFACDNKTILNDLHYGNIGLRKDGSPVIFDYSGFYY